ncbi:30S ribosomal protein S7 [bacterium]|jgi:small subunit ribosomal protein S7|nr:30S ribosomal protein S7 [bacterium]
MSRKNKDYKRIYEPDSIYNSINLTRFITKLMVDGKKSIAERVTYGALEKLAKAVSVAPIEAFSQAVQNATPQMEVKSRRVGGSTYQVPIEVPSGRGMALAMKWLIANARKRNGKSMESKLASELEDAYNKSGTTIKKREDTHKMAESNKAFAHFRW